MFMVIAWSHKSLRMTERASINQRDYCEDLEAFFTCIFSGFDSSRLRFPRRYKGHRA